MSSNITNVCINSLARLGRYKSYRLWMQRGKFWKQTATSERQALIQVFVCYDKDHLGTYCGYFFHMCLSVCGWPVPLDSSWESDSPALLVVYIWEESICSSISRHPRCGTEGWAHWYRCKCIRSVVWVSAIKSVVTTTGSWSLLGKHKPPVRYRLPSQSAGYQDEMALWSVRPALWLKEKEYKYFVGEHWRK